MQFRGLDLGRAGGTKAPLLPGTPLVIFAHRNLQEADMPMRGELPIPATVLGNYASADYAASSQFVAAITSPDAIAIVGFIAIGLLVTTGLVHFFPDQVP